MAGEDKEEFPPLLPAGFHVFDVAGVRRLCVDRFGASITRPRLMSNLEALIELVQRSGMRGEIWVDGSFTTEKLNPDDVDMVLVVSGDEYRTMNPEQRRFFIWFRDTSLAESHKCDNYTLIRDDAQPQNEYMFAYWLKQFGFSRGLQMKGLAVVKVPFLVTQ